MKVRVLYVEDDKDVQVAVTISLRLRGYEIFSAENGKIALDMLQRITVDVILLDIVMPVMNGFDFMREYDGNTPIILFSAWTDMKDLPYQPFMTLTKPTATADIIDAINAAVEQRKV